MIAPSTPIADALKALDLTLETPPQCRTAADLLVCLERGDVTVTAAQAKKIKANIAA